MNNIKRVKHILKDYLTFIPYLFSILLTIITFSTTKQFVPIIVGLIELFTIFSITNFSFHFNSIFANSVKSVLLLLYNMQMGLLFFGKSYLSLIMLTNLVSIKALSGNAVLYIGSILIVLFFTFLPVRKVQLPLLYSPIHTISLFLTLFVVEIGLLLMTQVSYSPTYSLIELGDQWYSQYQLTKSLNAQPNQTKQFYKSDILDTVSRPGMLSDKPNVILIFVEGLSQHIIDDNRQIMPNISRIQKESVSFDNYFNHTFATYKGLQGQLYSGYQMGDQDTNSLVSIADIFREAGYSTTFLNSEPNNKTFTTYLQQLGFERVIASDKLNKTTDTVSDKEMYHFLYNQMESEAKTNKPFFISMYMFGTHASLDSPNKKFRDGKSAELNKFYNLDYYFDQFIKKFNKTSASDNTLLVFTTDHATYVDNAYSNEFPDYGRANGMVDEIPLFFYYKGVEAQTIDVKGKNSLDLVPTIFDYIDYSSPNYFLGTSLFNYNSPNLYDTVFVSLETRLTTEGGKISNLSEEREKSIQQKLQKYFTAKRQKAEK